jgi:gentisate 1,2-dioxygenase
MQSGTYELADGRYLTVGVPGLSDLIGWRSIRVTPGHLGQLLAVFTAIEAKSPTGRVTNEQARFLSVVEEAGGLSGIARSQEDARRILFLDGST